MNKPPRISWKRLLAAWEKKGPAVVVELALAYLHDHPKSGAAWFILGETYGKMRRFDDSVHALKKCLQFTSPKNQVIAYRGLGDLYKRKGNLKASERWYRKAVEEKGDKAWDLICLGGVLARQGNFAEAKKYHRRATRIKSENRDEAHLKLGLILRAERKYANAIKCFDKAMEGEPKYKAAKRARRDVIAAMKIRNRR